MAITAGVVFECRDTATTNNVNGGGFSINSANFLTDATTDSNTANTASPVLSSASYNFVAGDVNAWVYIRSGTDWTRGWYQIASVASNKATLNAAVGAAVLLDSNGNYVANTVAGCAVVGTPTNGTFSVDYTQQNSPKFNGTNLSTSGAGATTVTSASASFTPVMVGNLLRITAGTGFATGWYEIVTFTDASNVVVDRTPTPGGAGSNGTFAVGGASSFNATGDGMLEAVSAGGVVWFKTGSYTGFGNLSISSTGTAAVPNWMIGYTSLRGDVCNDANRPFLNAGDVTMGNSYNMRNLSWRTSGAAGITIGTAAVAVNCKSVNRSSSGGQSAWTLGNDCALINCEGVACNGVAIQGGTRTKLVGCYVHDSVTGYNASTAEHLIVDCVFEACSTAAVTLSSTTGSHFIVGNTFYGREAEMGVGLNLTGNPSPACIIQNNIFYGLATAVSVNTTAQGSNVGVTNDFFNNTADGSNYSKGATDLAVDPQFVNAAQLTGTTATTASTTLTDSGADFSGVTDNVDFLRVISGTGVNVNCYQITGHTATTLTVVNSLGTSSAGDVVYFVTTGHNFEVGTNLKATGSPEAYGTETENFLDIGAAQREEISGGSFAFS